jgi:hypothetical protein
LWAALGGVVVAMAVVVGAIAQNSRLCGMPDENCFTEAPKKPTKAAEN